jgi:hypothetical protein
MSSGATSNPVTVDLKFGLFNAENLFLLFDQPVPPHFQKLSELQWQKLSNSVYENKPLSKCLEIAQLIKENDPDIMMFCEVGGLESLKNFNEMFLNSAYSVALIEGNSDRHIDVGFLIKKTGSFYFDLATNKNRPLNFLYPHETTSVKTGYPVKGVTHFFSRDCAELRLFRSDRNQPFLIILLTHLKSRLDPERIDPGGTERRTAELRTALDLYNEISAQHPNTPVIFAGDMNGFAGIPSTDPEFAAIYAETDLQDVLELANVSADKRSTFYQIKNGSKVDGKQIDYCFLPRSLKSNLKIESALVYRYKDEFGFSLDTPKSLEHKMKLPSDHYPLFFALEKLKI